MVHAVPPHEHKPFYCEQCRKTTDHARVQGDTQWRCPVCGRIGIRPWLRSPSERMRCEQKDPDA